jgi:hypothetical protein
LGQFDPISARGSIGRWAVVLDPYEVDLAAMRAVDSECGRLIMCVESRRTRFGLAGVYLSLERSLPTARLARRLRRLEGLASSSSKSVGKKAAGAVWKSTTAGAGLRSAADRVRKFPWDILCTRLPNESSDLALLVLEKLGERREKLLAMLAILSLRMTELAEARI